MAFCWPAWCQLGDTGERGEGGGGEREGRGEEGRGRGERWREDDIFTSVWLTLFLGYK